MNELLKKIYNEIGKNHLLIDVAEKFIDGSKESVPQAVKDSLNLLVKLGYKMYYIDCGRGKFAMYRIEYNNKFFECLDFCKPKKDAKKYLINQHNQLVKI